MIRRLLRALVRGLQRRKRLRSEHMLEATKQHGVDLIYRSGDTHHDRP